MGHAVPTSMADWLNLARPPEKSVSQRFFWTTCDLTQGPRPCAKTSDIVSSSRRETTTLPPRDLPCLPMAMRPWSRAFPPLYPANRDANVTPRAGVTRLCCWPAGEISMLPLSLMSISTSSPLRRPRSDITALGILIAAEFLHVPTAVTVALSSRRVYNLYIHNPIRLEYSRGAIVRQ